MDKKTSYILFEDESGATRVGFNRYNSPGFIDDGAGWSDQERDKFYETVVHPLDLEEVGSFMFEYQSDKVDLENKLQAMGMRDMDPAWT